MRHTIVRFSWHDKEDRELYVTAKVTAGTRDYYDKNYGWQPGDDAEITDVEIEAVDEGADTSIEIPDDVILDHADFDEPDYEEDDDDCDDDRDDRYLD